MIGDFYGLSFNPFDKQNTKAADCFESADAKQMKGSLKYLVGGRGIGLFTSSPGMGKTFALRCFAEGLNPNLYHMNYVCLTTVSVAEFYKQLCGVLGLKDRGGKTTMFREIQAQVKYLYKEKHQPLILAVDEAHFLSDSVLNDIQMLMNCDYDSLNCFTLILCGESYLNDIMNKPVHESLKQRITVHYNFVGLSDDEVIKYILHKINVAGGASAIIAESALNAVPGYSQRSPRIIDSIMSAALAIGATQDKKTIDADIIMAAVENQQFC